MFSRLLCALVLSTTLLGMTSCGEAEDEARLLNLFTLAELDIVDLTFPVEDNEPIISIDSFFDYSIRGLKSNMVDTIEISSDIVWSISDGATSTIDQNGRLTTGSVEETVTITATVGLLSASQQVFVSAAQFDQVVQFNADPVEVGMCQQTEIVPVGRYVRADMTEEIRRVDNADINSIEWIVLNKEDSSASQRAGVITTDNVTVVRGFESGDVIVQAKAFSKSAGVDVTSVDFDQTVDNNVLSLKLCDGDAPNLTTCTPSNVIVAEEVTDSVKVVGRIQASNGFIFNQNITALSKWGIDNTANASIALSTDREQLDITGNIENTGATVSVACGDIEQAVTNEQLNDGVVLGEAVSCASGSTTCVSTSGQVEIRENVPDSIAVTVNGISARDNAELPLTGVVTSLQLEVRAVFSVAGSVDITADSGVSYTVRTPNSIVAVAGVPGRYNVVVSDLAVIDINYLDLDFTVRVALPGGDLDG